MVFISRGGAGGGSGGNIASGTYVGTGLYGPENPTNLQLSFIPKLVLIWEISVEHEKNNGTNFSYPISIFPEQGIGIAPYEATIQYMFYREALYVETIGSSLKFYSTESGRRQANEQGKEYVFVALG